jgi:hypothetical protein
MLKKRAARTRTVAASQTMPADLHWPAKPPAQPQIAVTAHVMCRWSMTGAEGCGAPAEAGCCRLRPAPRAGYWSARLRSLRLWLQRHL